MRKSIKLGKNTSIDVVDEGDGPVVVFIHGWPVTNYHWRKIQSKIVDAGYRTLLVTPRGLGSASEGSGNCDKLTISKEITATLRILGVTAYALVGHDWGGTIGYFMCAENRDYCWAFAIEEEILPGINLSIPEPGSRYYPDWHGPFNRSVGLGEKLIPGKENDYYGTFLKESSGIISLEESAISTYLESYSIPSQLVNTLGYYRTKEIDTKEIFTRIGVPLMMPILAIGGEYGMGKSVEIGMRHVAKKVNGYVLENAGHYPAEQTPDKFAALLVSFLSESLAIFKQGKDC
jgi:haloacetate dehalogenase